MNKVPGLNSNVFFDPVGLPFSQVSSEVAFPTGCVAYFKLDETSGTTVIDSVAGNNGTNNGATVNVTGKIGKAYSFDGVNDYVNLSSIISILEDNSTSTISTWIKPVDATPSNYQVILSISDVSEFTIFNIYINITDGRLAASYTIGGVTQWSMITTYAPFSDNTWTHLFFVKTASSVEVYVNNSLITIPFVNESDKTKWLSNATGLDTVQFGSQQYNGAANPAQFYEGLQDEVSFFNRILTEDERQYVMDNSYPF